jgi:RimJ/RimL family protein N-acetyltransferase
MVRGTTCQGFWDNSQSHRDDILIFMNGRKEPSLYFDGIFDYWIGLMDNEPYCLIMTSEILFTQTNLPDLWRSNLSKKGKTFSIDFMIGNQKYFGKGLAAPTLEAFTGFIKNKFYPPVDTFYIDPEESNPRAKHVYEKAGFCYVADFHRDCNGGKDVRHFLMIKKLFSVEKVSPDTQEEMVDFLKRHENYSLFLLGNFENYGAILSDSPYSGNFKLIRSSDEIVSVFCLTKKGSLLIQSVILEPIFDFVLASCLQEPIPITGLVGNWDFCQLFWKFLKQKALIQSETFASKEILYKLDLSKISYPLNPDVRILTADDYNQWKPLRLAYLQEEGFPNDLNDEQLLQSFLEKCKKRIIWGYFLMDRLVSIADLNAKASDLGQLGGVYTDPNFRKKGYSKAVIHKLVSDIKEIHNIRKLIIFTGENNFPAQKLYESLAVNPVGYFALLFGK